MIYFSPEQDCITPLMAAVNAARRQVRIAAYVLTLRPLITALVRLHAVGIDVSIVLDASEAVQRASAVGLAALRAGGVPVVTGTSSRGGLIHDKVCIIDGLITIHGSLNASNVAQAQCNTLEIVRSRPRAAAFLAHWQRVYDHAAAHPGAMPLTTEEV